MDKLDPKNYPPIQLPESYVEDEATSASEEAFKKSNPLDQRPTIDRAPQGNVSLTGDNLELSATSSVVQETPKSTTTEFMPHTIVKTTSTTPPRTDIHTDIPPTTANS